MLDLQKLESNTFIAQGGVIVGDAAFSLKQYLMTPYPGKKLNFEEKIYNYRLSRARRIVENAFGILVNRFRIFEKAISTKLGTVDDVIYAACSLHNWLRKKSSSYIIIGNVDREDTSNFTLLDGDWRHQINPLQSITHQGSNNSTQYARAKRLKLTHYFVNDGALSWQNNMIHQCISYCLDNK